MNRFDRVTALLLLLQTRSVVTAAFLAERFGVSERTVYRDIRTLENAGVPIGAEAGVGYYLEKGYRLPPVSFTLDEAAALLLGEKLLVASLDAATRHDFQQALDKVRAVVDRDAKDALVALDDDSAVVPTGSAFPIDAMQREAFVANGGNVDEADASGGEDRWLRDARTALMRRQVVTIDYAALGGDTASERRIEPIGLFHYSWHWHLIAWCRLREDYRDFRLDRIRRFAPTDERFLRRERLTLNEYLDARPGRDELMEIELRFTPAAARYVAEQRYLFGFVEETREADGVRMRFLTAMPDYLARWLLQYLDEVDVIRGESIREALRGHTRRLSAHWNGPPEPS